MDPIIIRIDNKKVFKQAFTISFAKVKHTLYDPFWLGVKIKGQLFLLQSTQHTDFIHTEEDQEETTDFSIKFVLSHLGNMQRFFANVTYTHTCQPIVEAISKCNFLSIHFTWIFSYKIFQQNILSFWQLTLTYYFLSVER